MTDIYLNNSNLPAVSRELTEDELAQVALKFAGDDAEQAMVLLAQAHALEIGEELLLTGAYYLTRGRNCAFAEVVELSA